MASQTFQVTLADVFVLFLWPNQYVNDENAPNTIAKAAECEGTSGKVGDVYFDGKTWRRMDPTCMSSGKGRDTIRKFVGDDNNDT